MKIVTAKKRRNFKGEKSEKEGGEEESREWLPKERGWNTLMYHFPNLLKY